MCGHTKHVVHHIPTHVHIHAQVHIHFVHIIHPRTTAITLFVAAADDHVLFAPACSRAAAVNAATSTTSQVDGSVSVSVSASSQRACHWKRPAWWEWLRCERRLIFAGR